MDDFPTRFWSKVDVRGLDECWEWQGCHSSGGYGCIWTGKRQMGAHRVSWEIHSGREIPEGMVVMHTCDNRSCVNPAHLRIGTQHENLLDAVAKGRNVRGSRLPQAKLVEGQVREIRRLHAEEGVRAVRLSEQFGVQISAIVKILKQRTWAWLA